MRSLALALLAALTLAAPAAAQTWTVPDHSGDDVTFVLRYWETVSDGTIKVVIEESDGTVRLPAPEEATSMVSKNASFSAAKAVVEPGDSVGVIIVPMDRGLTKPEITFGSRELVGYVGLGLLVGALLGYLLGLRRARLGGPPGGPSPVA